MSSSTNRTNHRPRNKPRPNFAGRGPKHFGPNPTRPDSVLPRHETLDLLERHDPTQEHCLVCYSSQLPRHRTVSPCGHDDICAPCSLRLRYLHEDRRCVVCKGTNETVIVRDDAEGIKRFEEYQSWGEDLGSGFVYRDDCGMHFPRTYYETVVLPLFGYRCGLEGCDFDESEVYVDERERDQANGGRRKPVREVKKRLTNLDALKAHLRTDHGMTLCDLCVGNKRDFVSKLMRFTPAGMKTHLTKGDGEHSGFSGHPICEFCRPQRFYDIVKLHEHLNKDHYKCHICDKMGKPNQFFKDYTRLETHFDRDHYLCANLQCLDARYIVFEHEIDLKAHEASVHGVSTRRDGGTKIKLEFRVRREGEQLEQSLPTGEDFQYGLNGEAFVPDALPGDQRQLNEPDISHPLHAARTAELRAMAAQIREGMDDGSGALEDFPALGDAAAEGSWLSVGWSATGAPRAVTTTTRLKKTPVGQVNDEEFPSLGGGSNNYNRYQVLGLGRKTNSKQPTLPAGANFSAVAAKTGHSSSAAAKPLSSSSKPISTVSYSSSIPFSRPPEITRDNFPSLSLAHRTSPQAFVPTMTSSNRAPDFTGNDFPSLGGPSFSAKTPTSQNPYTAAQALGRKFNAGKKPGSAPSNSFQPSISSSAEFPPPPTASSKRSTVVAAFESKKPPLLDNILQFPPPSSSKKPSTEYGATKPTKSSAECLESGMDTVEQLKEHLGPVQYKKLKTLTKSFANGSLSPEHYVEEAAALFDKGLAQKFFWSYVPDLIVSCPNSEGIDRALKYLESARLANEMQELEFQGTTIDRGFPPKKTPINYMLPTKKNENRWTKNSGSAAGRR